MLPAFCFSPYFLDPVDAKDRCTAIQRTRNTKNTDDIWEEEAFRAWARSDEYSFLLLRGNSQTAKRLERFAVQVIDALQIDERGNPARLIYIVNPPPRQELNLPVHFSATDILRQVAIQSLRFVTPPHPVVFLIELFARFRGASTSEDWLAILQEIIMMVPNLYIIVDLAILGMNDDEAQSCLAGVQGLCNALKDARAPCCLKVILLSCRRITSQTDAVVSIRAAPLDSTTPSRHRIRRRQSTLCHLKKPLPDKGSIPYTSSHPNRPFGRLVDASDPIVPSPLETALDQASLHANPTTSYENEPHFPCEPRHRDQFKVGIICALGLEADAVTAIFDKLWDSGENKYGKAPGDTNYYRTGAIGRHNVVLVYAHGMGKSNAASVAANCRASFKNLGIMLVVGICGGVPYPKSENEIVLGDVIISDGLIQYDFGRQFPDKFVRKGTMSKPKDEIMATFAYLTGKWGLPELQRRTTAHLMKLRSIDKMKNSAEYPGVDKDKLYEPTYRHKHQVSSSCQICDRCRSSTDPTCEAALELKCESLECHDERLVPRKRLADTANNAEHDPSPRVHFGHYASGDKVMKSGEERDTIARTEGVIAFEMEGSGVWERFPSSCLIIKGVCDYADSHKNKEWQAYAAATAAACAKAFLEYWYAQE